MALTAAPAAMVWAATPAAAQTGGTAAEQAEAARFTAFIDNEFEQELKQRPQRATALGRKQDNDKWDDTSDAGQLKLLEWRRGSVARMKAQFDRAKLPPETRASYDMWAMELERAELTYKYRRYQPPFYSFLYSIHAELPNFLINTQAVTDAADMKGWNTRLKTMGAVLDRGIAQSKQSTAMGIRAPKFEIERVIAGSKVMIAGQPFTDSGADSPLWADAKAKVGRLRAAGKITDAEADALLAEARAGVLGIKAPYERVIAWAEGELPNAPSGKTGAVSLPNGLEWYAAALKLNTTTDLTPDQVHELGLKEVERIQKEQDALAQKAGFKDRQAFYDDRAKKFPPTPWTDAIRADYLRQYNETIARNRSLLPKVFTNLPVYKAEVVREPSFSEVAGGAAHASGPNADGTRPGRVYIHMLGVTDDPANITDLMCHEGIPGHVMQGDIQVRQKGVPKFRSAYRYVAYGEGWALYTEYLCKEMGAYQDVASDFFRLDAELFRAARLVTDTGIHAKGWTEDQAVDYMIKTGRRPPNQARSEVRRYITLPGQATGYKIGMLKIMELRHKAEA
ncbi:MAG: DUF885 domain-containing protein, partial [Proteobacteria bacterium]|nr:DUF885 domain-containing protein [Pseudomonadota bacterium]